MGFGEDLCREFPVSLLSPLETTPANSTDKSAPSKAKGWEKDDQTTEDFSAHSYPTLGTHQQKSVPHLWFQQTEGELASHSPSSCRSRWHCCSPAGWWGSTPAPSMLWSGPTLGWLLFCAGFHGWGQAGSGTLGSGADYTVGGCTFLKGRTIGR